MTLGCSDDPPAGGVAADTGTEDVLSDTAIGAADSALHTDAIDVTGKDVPLICPGQPRAGPGR